MLPPVRPGDAVAGLLGHERAGVCVRAGIEQHHGVARHQRAVGHDAGAKRQAGVVLAHRPEALVERQAIAHRRAGLERQQRGDGLGLAAVLGPETPAEIADMHAHPLLADAQQACHLLADREGVLATRPQFQPAVVAGHLRRPPGHCDERFEVKMLLATVEREDVGEDVVAALEGCWITGLVAEAVTDIGARPGTAARALAVGGRHPQGCLGEDLRCAGRERLVEVRDRRQWLVGDLHQRQRSGRVELGFCSDGDYRVADAADALKRKDRLVLDEVAVAVRGHERRIRWAVLDITGSPAITVLTLEQVTAGEHCPHTGSLFGGGGVDAGDERMGMGRAEHFGVQHPRECHVDGVRRSA